MADKKNEYKNIDASQLSEWSFPSVELVIKEKDSFSGEKGQNTSPDTKNEKSPDHTLALLEIEGIKKEYLRKMTVVNQILGQIEKPLAAVDKELTDLMQDIVKSAIKKIIVKEIQLDPELIKKIVDELSALIPAQNEVLTVFLSEADYNKISADYNQAGRVLKVNSSLSEGDIIIKSNVNEIHALLDDRINQLIGTKNV